MLSKSKSTTIAADACTSTLANTSLFAAAPATLVITDFVLKDKVYLIDLSAIAKA
jgi:hypothetical protein